jgi:hypothetical protein
VYAKKHTAENEGQAGRSLELLGRCHVPLRSDVVRVTFATLALLPMTVFESHSTLDMMNVK